MKKRVLITGGSGLVGSRLTQTLLNKNYEVSWLSRSGKSMPNVQGYRWNIADNYIEKGALENVDTIIHLAGEGIADKRWTKNLKALIINSRVDTANLIFNYLQSNNLSIGSFISASGAGYYGYENGDKELIETDKPGDDFVAEVVKLWEQAANQFEVIGIRTVKLRTGVVLSEKGGAIEKMALPIRWGVGSPLGSGNQHMSWIHINDLCSMMMYVMENEETTGVYNASAPTTTTNKELTQALAKVLHRPLIFPNVPKWSLKLLLGEMHNIIIGSNKMSSNKIVGEGFKFEYNDIDSAIESLLNRQ
jgi:uncharacterized protein (TIGR01777 family)